MSEKPQVLTPEERQNLIKELSKLAGMPEGILATCSDATLIENYLRFTGQLKEDIVDAGKMLKVARRYKKDSEEQ